MAFAINTCHIILTCLAVMINLTTTSTCQSTTTHNMSVFVGTSSLFRRIFILLTPTTPCEVKFSDISSSPTPSKSLDLITPLHEFREECGVTLIGTLQRSLDLRRLREWLSVAHSTNRVPFRNFFTDLRLSANPCSPLSIAKGESFARLLHQLTRLLGTLARF